MAAQLRNLFIKTDTAETRGDTRSQRYPDASITSDRVAKDLADLFFGAASVTARATLKLLLQVIVELANEDLSHG